LSAKPSGNYRASYVEPDGQRHVASKTYPAKVDAETWLTEVQGQIRREVWKSPYVIQAETFGPYATTWLAQRRTKKGETLRLRTQEMYQDVITRGLARFRSTRMTDLTVTMIRKWHADRTRDSGAAQAGLEARTLRAILGTAAADGVIAANPCPSELTRSKTGRLHRPPTSEELAVILDVIAPRFKLAVQLAAFGGLRLSEWRGLRRADLNLTAEGHYVASVTEQALRVAGEWITGDPKSDAGVREVALPSWLTDDVTAHLDTHVGPFPKNLLFPSGGVSEYADMAWLRAWDRARIAAGVRWLEDAKGKRMEGTDPWRRDKPGPHGGLGQRIEKIGKWVSVVREHDLRAYYATTLLKEGASTFVVQRAGGWSDVRAMAHYVKLTNGADTATANLLQRPIAPSQPSNVVALAR